MIETLTFLFDTALCMTLLLVAWQSLTNSDLFKAIVLFITFGLLLALAWIRLNAIDVAMAEVAIGAGLSGALLLASLAKLRKLSNVKQRKNE
jgi:energy-converting hydrogenase B subunit D